MKPAHEELNARVDRVKRAMEHGMQNDLRFKMLVDGCVVEARRECGPVDPDHAERAAYEQARYAAALLLARVYDEDGELAAMRAERDHYKSLAEKALALQPAVPFVMPKS